MNIVGNKLGKVESCWKLRMMNERTLRGFAATQFNV